MPARRLLFPSGMERATRHRRPRIAFVLSGGGARGAYEAGVICYLQQALQRDTGVAPRFDILCGTSVGGIHAGVLAALAHDPAGASRSIAATWRTLTPHSVVEVNVLDSLRFGAGLLGIGAGRTRRGGLLRVQGLERLVGGSCDWTRIGANIAAGHLASVSISATHVATGKTVVFVQTADDVLPRWSRDPRVEAVAARIGPPHALASASLPLLFPPVEVDGQFYCDGGVRQNTPLSPALRLGADRVLIVSLRHTPREAETRLESLLGREREKAMPTPAFLAGKVLNALLLDHLDTDLDRMHRINAVLSAGEEAFGPDFAARLNPVVDAARGTPMRRVAHVKLSPSEDLGAMAARYVRSRAFDRRRKGLAGALLKRLALSDARVEADLLSYVLFDGEYASLLLDLGWSDAHARRHELAQLFSDAPARAVAANCPTVCNCAATQECVIESSARSA